MNPTPVSPAAPTRLRTHHVRFMDDRSPVTRVQTSLVPCRETVQGEHPLSDAAVAFLGEACRTRGLDVRRYRANALRRREAACLRAARAESLEEGLRRLQEGDVPAERVMDALLIGVTSFFRDPLAFEELADFLRRRGREKAGLRVLSVGCSDGCEVYSTAMLLDRLGLLEGSSLLGIDCRACAIETARRGTYSTASVEQLDDEAAARWLEPAGGLRGRDHVQIAARLREACSWRMADAFTLTDADAADVVLCRNLLIYLTPSAADEMWATLARLVRPGGALMVGKAERAPAWTGLRRIGPCLYTRPERGS